MRGRCHRGQTRVSWNQRGPAGPQGQTGATGPAGAPPPSAWGIVTNNGTPLVAASYGISATRVSAGTYQVSITAPACAGKVDVPQVTVSDLNPPAGQFSGASAVAWVLDVSAPGVPFTVYTGDVVGGTFTPSDHTFNIQDVCGT